jgi:hypothetical protein
MHRGIGLSGLRRRVILEFFPSPLLTTGLFMIGTGFSSQGVDLEAQPEDSGHGMFVFSLFSESLPSSSTQI